MTRRDKHIRSDFDSKMMQEEEIKQAKKNYSRIGWCFVAGTILIEGLQVVLLFLMRQYKPEWVQNLSLVLLCSTVITYGIGLPMICFFGRNLPKTVPPRRETRFWQFVLMAFMCYALVYASNLVGTFLTLLIGMAKGSAVNNRLLQYITDGNLWMNAFIMVGLAPVFEELVFRKFLVNRTLQYGQGVAILTSALMFGLFHGNLNQFAYAFVLGAFFAFIYIKTGKIHITMGLHAVINFMGSVPATWFMSHLNLEELEGLDTNELMQAAMNGIVDPQMQEIMERNMPALMGLCTYAVWLLSVVLIGWILLITFHKLFRLEHVPGQIPKGKRFSVMFLNPGMLIFCVIWIGMILWQLAA